MPNVYVGTGYNKWGMTTSNVAANIIVDKILGVKNVYEEIFSSERLQLVKNHKEFGNMVKEVGNSLIVKRIKNINEDLKNVKQGEGKIVMFEGKKVGAYKNESGEIFGIKPYCSHLGCELIWNNLDKTWDCPCHGSRFDYEGKSLQDPSIKNLKKINLQT